MSSRHQPGYMPWDRTGNRVLVQSSLGKSKPTNYDIPDQNFAYGKSTHMDPEKANQMMYNWKYHENSDNKNVGKVKDLITTNKAALKQKATTSSTNYDFRKTQTFYKAVKEGSNHIKIKLPEQGFTYGKPLELEDPIKLVIANDYGQSDKFFRHSIYQMKLSQQKPKRKLSCHITKNHNLLKEATAKRMALFDWARRSIDKQQWKLSKYNIVQGKVDTNRRPFSSNQGRKSAKLVSTPRQNASVANITENQTQNNN